MNFDDARQTSVSFNKFNFMALINDGHDLEILVDLDIVVEHQTSN